MSRRTQNSPAPPTQGLSEAAGAPRAPAVEDANEAARDARFWTTVTALFAGLAAGGVLVVILESIRRELMS